MVLTLADKTELWALHWEALDDSVAYWPAVDEVVFGEVIGQAWPAKQGDHPCAVLDRPGTIPFAGEIAVSPNETARVLVLKRTAPRPKGGDRYLWGAQWLQVLDTDPAGTNGPVLYVATIEIDPEVTP